MPETLIQRKNFGPYGLEVWSDGIRATLVNNDEPVLPKDAANALRRMADYLEFCHVTGETK